MTEEEEDHAQEQVQRAQIVGTMKEHQAGLGAAELCRKYGISDATFYKWRSKYGGWRCRRRSDHGSDRPMIYKGRCN